MKNKIYEFLKVNKELGNGGFLHTEISDLLNISTKEVSNYLLELDREGKVFYSKDNTTYTGWMAK